MRITPLLSELSSHLQADLAIGATIVFLIFASWGLFISSRTQPIAPANGRAPVTPGDSPLKKMPVPALTILTGLLCGLAVLLMSGC